MRYKIYLFIAFNLVGIFQSCNEHIHPPPESLHIFVCNVELLPINREIERERKEKRNTREKDIEKQ